MARKSYGSHHEHAAQHCEGLCLGSQYGGTLSTLKKGTFYLAAAWGMQLVAGWGIASWVSRQLGVEAYGTYGVIMSVLIWIEVGAISGLPTAVQKYVASHESETRYIVALVNRAQFVFVAVLFAMTQLLAPAIASLLGNGSFTFLIRLASWDIWVYSYFFVYMSVQNGLKHFGRHALLLGFYSLSKLTAAVVLVTVWPVVDSALVANIVGSVMGLLMALWFYRRVVHQPSVKPTLSWRTLCGFAWPVALYSLITQLFPNVDLWFIQALCGEEAPGYYTAATNFARIPFYLFFGLSATVLPAVSRSLAQNNHEEARQTIESAVRLLVLSVLPLTVVVWPWARGVVFLLFEPSFEQAAGVLRVLIIGHSALAFVFLMNTILNADGRPKWAMWLTAVVVLLDIALLMVLTPRWGMAGAAWSTTAALLMGSVITGWPVWRRFRLRIPLLFWGKAALASVVVGALARLLVFEGLGLLAAGTFLALVYMVLLWALKLADPRDLFSIAGKGKI